jgi:DNA-binding CsgD family transcriptional regulator
MGDRVIRVVRARAAMKLIGEVYEIGVRTEAGRRHLMRELFALLGCAVGASVHDIYFSPGHRRGIVAATLAGFDSQVTDLFDAHYTMGSAFNPFHRAVMARAHEPGEVFSSTDLELVPRSVWNRSPWINDYVRPAGIEHFMASIRFVGETTIVGCGLMRAAGDRPFSDEDREVMHLVNDAVGPLFDAAAPHLAPRAREVRDALLTGASDKEIAQLMRISVHTVHQYVKAIFRAYGVSSRAQLFAHAMRSS